jgi:hypothetical protein
MWTRKDYEDAGERLGKDFVTGNGEISINKLATKVAADNNLSPEGIRTVVRIANNAAFTETFAKAANESATDRMIEFEVGDPDVVISNLASAVQEKIAHVQEDPSYNRQVDYFGDLGSLEKTAKSKLDDPRETEHYIGNEDVEDPVEVGVEAPIADKKKVKALFADAKKKMDEEAKEAAQRWGTTMEAATQSVKVAFNGYQNKRSEFVKNAVATLGVDIVPELKGLHIMLNLPLPHVIADMEKAAQVVEHHLAIPMDAEKPIFALLKRANDARKKIDVCKQSILLIESGE